VTSKGKNIILALMVVCLLIAVRGYADDKTGVKIDKNKAAKEVLVASFIDNENFDDTPSWCGNDRFMFRGDLISLNGKKVHVIRKNEEFYGCTPDGKWVLYVDKTSEREYRDIWGTVPDEIVDDPYTWRTTVLDYYRYEVVTGARQKFAVAETLSSFIFSPNGKKLLIDRDRSLDIPIDVPKPEWEKVWLTNEWGLDGTYWFSDSLGIVTYGPRFGIGIELFGKGGWRRAYGYEQLGIPPALDGYLDLLGVDKNNRIYFLIKSEIYSLIDKMSYHTGIMRYYVFRCNVKEKAISCEAQGAFEGKDIASPKLLPSGEIIFYKYLGHNSCIWRLRLGENKARCMINKRYGSDTYDKVGLDDISPDGKRILFSRAKALKKSKGKDVRYKVDIFVKDLSENQ